MDTKLLLDFLSAPRTISEIAEYFSILPTQAERLVLEAMGSGRVRVSSLALRASRREGRLPSTTGKRVSAHMNLNKYGRLRFELRRPEPNLVHGRSKPAVVAGFFGTPKRPVRVHSMSPSLLMKLLESIEKSPKPLSEIRGGLEVTRRIIERLVRKGLVEEVWGRKGVGLSYGITSHGLKELERLRQVLDSADKLAERPLPSLKVRVTA